MQSPLRIGVVGAGQMSELTAQALRLHPEVELIAVVDPNEARRLDFSKRFGVPLALPTADELFESGTVEAVYIATPNLFHAPLARAALESGHHVLLEKPFALNAAEAEGVIRTATAAGRALLLGMNHRFFPAAQLVRELVREGQLGEVYHGRAFWRRRSGIPRLGTWFGQKSAAGGGALLDIGVHLLDLALFLLDDFEPVAVSGATQSVFGARGLGEGGWGRSDPGPHPFDVDDFATALLRFSNGASLSLEVSWALHQPLEEEHDVVLYGTEAGASLHPGRLHRWGTTRETYLVEPLAQRPLLYPHQSVAHHFVDVALGRAEPCVTASQALAVQRVLDAIAESAASGREVRLQSSGGSAPAAQAKSGAS